MREKIGRALRVCSWIRWLQNPKAQLIPSSWPLPSLSDKKGTEVAAAEGLLVLWERLQEEGRVLCMPDCERQEGGWEFGDLMFVPCPFPMAQMLAGSQTGTVLRVFRELSTTASCAMGWHSRLEKNNRGIFLPHFFNCCSVSYAACEQSDSHPLSGRETEAWGSWHLAKSNAKCDQRARTAILHQPLGKSDKSGCKLQFAHFSGLSSLARHEASPKYK